MNSYKVSVVVPVYNSEKTLKKTLSALLSQTLKDLQIICINDGSTDSSQAILEYFAKENPNMVVIKTDNKGAYKAREEGIRIAIGDYIGFCDADDEPLPNFYEKMVDKADKEGADLVVSAYTRIKDNGSSNIEMSNFCNTSLPISSDSGWLVSVNTALWNKIVKAPLVKEVPKLQKPPRIMEDALLLFLIYPKAKKIAFINEPLYNYYIASNSTMSTTSFVEINEILACWDQVRKNASDTEDKFEEIIDLAVFVHLKVSATLSLSNNPNISIKKYLAFIDKQLNRRFPFANNSPFMKCSYLKNNKQLTLVKLAYVASKLNVLGIAIKTYKRLSRFGKTEIKW